ncbi:protein MEN-8-like [Chenopodium quinoa]|uniref:Bifunctional inhibitor/plant lipid transfer protein/seed storage helical domain-containing protein n=1 Tax=Chenopodium quinoa TaxID=63459 RepID=A0A803M0H3_CHEQI|nr:protein MEN-8-like [Chenopodium quinoa]
MASISMKSSTSSFQKMALVILVLALVVQLKGSMAQSTPSSTCASQLGGLNTCAPFVVPGQANANPSAECCGALQSVNHDCLCNTLRVASQLPASCNLPVLNCSS